MPLRSFRSAPAQNEPGTDECKMRARVQLRDEAVVSLIRRRSKGSRDQGSPVEADILDQLAHPIDQLHREGILGLRPVQLEVGESLELGRASERRDRGRSASLREEADAGRKRGRPRRADEQSPLSDCVKHCGTCSVATGSTTRAADFAGELHELLGWQPEAFEVGEPESGADAAACGVNVDARTLAPATFRAEAPGVDASELRPEWRRSLHSFYSLQY